MRSICSASRLPPQIFEDQSQVGGLTERGRVALVWCG